MVADQRYEAGPRSRLLAVLIYAALLVWIQARLIDTGLTPNENAIWLYNGLASLLFGSRLLNPYFTPPLDAATNAFAALSSLIAGALVIAPGTQDADVLTGVIIFASTVLALSLLTLLLRPPLGVEQPVWLQAIDRLSRKLGSPVVIFTIVVIASVWLFHRDKPNEVIAIVSAYAVIAIVHPIEGAIAFGAWLRSQAQQQYPSRVIGPVAAYQTPNIALIRQSTDDFIARGSPLLVGGEEGKWLLGVALNYVGRDERNLLRVLTTTLPQQFAEQAQHTGAKPTDRVAITLEIPPENMPQVPALEWINRMCGIVDSDTTSEFLRFEVIDDKGLSEGRLVEARVGQHRSVLFQLIEGVTHEEIVQQKNKYGYARATARKIGRWDADANRFSHVPWLPRLNTPVFLREEDEFVPTANAIGHFPSTSFGVSVTPSELVTHNTAILGILGVGKSYLAAELIERMIADGIKVIALDLTDQYATTLLPEFLDPAYEQAQRDALVEAGRGGKAHLNREQGGSIRTFKRTVFEQVAAFMNPDNGRYLRVMNPAQFRVTKQTGFLDRKTEDAELTHLTPSEITGIVSEAALHVCQQLGMVSEARLCLVYEEAHSLVPERNSVASPADEKATAVSARAILQGRKYGLGCLLITQRTANVTKSILNQCNTVFAMRMFDETGKEFLANYVGRDFASVLPTLEHRHAILFGKGSCCENPVLLELNNRDDFNHAFRAAHPPRQPPAEEPKVAGQEEPKAAPAGGEEQGAAPLAAEAGAGEQAKNEPELEAPDGGDDVPF